MAESPRGRSAGVRQLVQTRCQKSALRGLDCSPPEQIDWQRSPPFRTAQLNTFAKVIASLSKLPQDLTRIRYDPYAIHCESLTRVRHGLGRCIWSRVDVDSFGESAQDRGLVEYASKLEFA